MILNEMTSGALQDVAALIGDGPVVMVNLLWLREAPLYPAGFAAGKTTAREAYFEGYAGEFRNIAQKLGITTRLIYVGDRLAGLLAGPDDDWDLIVMVEYQSLQDLRMIIESDAYGVDAAPHRQAAIANWRFFATKQFA